MERKNRNKSERFERIPFLSLSPTSTTQYYRIFDKQVGDFLKPKFKLKCGTEVAQKPPTFREHSGDLSPNAVRNLKRSVNTLLCGVDENIMIDGSGKDKITFVTLTLSSEQIKSISSDKIEYFADDKEIKSDCFNQLMTELRQTKGVENYVWKAEKQLNGNLHFHILLDRKIEWYWLRERWNSLQNKFGFVDRYAEKMRKMTYQEYEALRLTEMKVFTDKHKRSKVEAIKKAWDYGVKTNWTDPNSTDIQTLKKVQNVASYICKYMSKTSENSKINSEKARLSALYDLPPQKVNVIFQILGRIWQCSQKISKARKCVVYEEKEYNVELGNLIESEKSVKVIIDENATDEKESYFTAILHTFKQLKTHCKTIYETFISHIKAHFDNAVNSVVSTVGAVSSVPVLSTVQSSKFYQTRLQFSYG